MRKIQQRSCGPTDANDGCNHTEKDEVVVEHTFYPILTVLTQDGTK